MKRRNFLKAVAVAVVSPQVLEKAAESQPFDWDEWLKPKPLPVMSDGAKAFWLRVNPDQKYYHDNYVKAMSGLFNTGSPAKADL